MTTGAPNPRAKPRFQWGLGVEFKLLTRPVHAHRCNPDAAISRLNRPKIGDQCGDQDQLRRAVFALLQVEYGAGPLTGPPHKLSGCKARAAI